MCWYIEHGVYYKLVIRRDIMRFEPASDGSAKPEKKLLGALLDRKVTLFYYYG
jgi:hypothetical protein